MTSALSFSLDVFGGSRGEKGVHESGITKLVLSN